MISAYAAVSPDPPAPPDGPRPQGMLHVLPFAVLLPLALLTARRLLRRGRAGEGDAAEQAGRLRPARALLTLGEVLALFLIAGGVVHGSLRGESLAQDVLWTAAFAGTGLLLFLILTPLSLRLSLGPQLAGELDHDNAACGVAAAAHAVACGVITARAVAGYDIQHLGLSLVFFALSQVSLHLLLLLFRALTAYDDRDAILGGNLAAALSYAGATLAVALLVGRAVDGEFTGWGPSLRGYGLALLQGLCIYPARQLVVQGLLLRTRPTLRGGALDRLVGTEGQIGVGLLEGGTYVAAALLLQRVS